MSENLFELLNQLAKTREGERMFGLPLRILVSSDGSGSVGFEDQFSANSDRLFYFDNESELIEHLKETLSPKS